MDVCREKTLIEKIKELDIPEEKKKELIDDVNYFEEQYSNESRARYHLMVERDRLTLAIIELAKDLGIMKEKERLKNG